MFNRAFISCLISASALLAPLTASAGIPVIDATSVAQQIQQVVAWGQQAQQMMQQITQLQNQLTQLQTITNKLDGARSLGTILQDPSIRSALPSEFTDSSQLLLNPSGRSASTQQLDSVLSSFGIDTTQNPNLARANADGFVRAQQVLTSTQARQNQTQQLAARVDNSADSKSSIDLLNRNTLELADIVNTQTQAQARYEAARHAQEMEDKARTEQRKRAMAAGLRQPVQQYKLVNGQLVPIN